MAASEIATSLTATSEERLNQAIAIVQGTMTRKGLVVHGKLIETKLSPKFRRWRRSKMLPLEYESRFRVWPRTNKSGELIKVCVVLPNRPLEEEGSIIAGYVFRKREDRLIIRVTPDSNDGPMYGPQFREGVRPFNVVVLDNQPEQQPSKGWWVQCVCELTEDHQLQLKSWRSLKHLLPNDKPSENEVEPKPGKDTETELELVSGIEPATEREKQGNASSSPVSPELTPEMQECLKQARALFERAKLATSPGDKAQLEAIAHQILEESLPSENVLELLPTLQTMSLP